jgi:hypothetical protein
MKHAKAAFLAACGAPPAARRRAALAGEAEISGVGFFGPRGRADAARNGIELHPVLGFKAVSCRRRSVPGDGSGKKAARRRQANKSAQTSGRS